MDSLRLRIFSQFQKNMPGNPKQAFWHLCRRSKPFAAQFAKGLPAKNMSVARQVAPSLFARPTTGFDDFFSPLLKDPFFNFMPVLRNFERDSNMILSRSSPGYEINEDENKYQIAIDVPGVKAGDLDVELEQEGRVLRLSGGRKLQKGSEITETKFDKRFWIGENIDTSNIAANLSDGVLVVTAQKKPQEEEKAIKIAITEGINENK
jgi:HSP20 family protein